jgi:intergrase/recombinase
MNSVTQFMKIYENVRLRNKITSTYKNLQRQKLFHLVSLEYVRNFNYLGYSTGYQRGQ